MAGTMRERKNNSWYLEYMFEGERYSQTVKASSPSEAKRKLALFVSDIERGKYTKETGITFTEFAQLFIDKYATDNLSPTTLDDYKSRLNKYILEEIGRLKLTKIKRLQIQEFANKLVKEYNLSSKTAKNYIKLISSILSKAVEWDFIEYNVADKVSIPKNLSKPKKQVILYSYNEIFLFLEKLEALEDLELKMAIYTSLYSGARRNEVLALTFEDIDCKQNIIYIEHGKVAVSRWYSNKGYQDG